MRLAQCQLVAFDGGLRTQIPETLAIMRATRVQFVEAPWCAFRQAMRHPRRSGPEIGRTRGVS